MVRGKFRDGWSEGQHDNGSHDGGPFFVSAVLVILIVVVCCALGGC